MSVLQHQLALIPLIFIQLANVVIGGKHLFLCFGQPLIVILFSIDVHLLSSLWDGYYLFPRWINSGEGCEGFDSFELIIILKKNL